MSRGVGEAGGGRMRQTKGTPQVCNCHSHCWADTMVAAQGGKQAGSPSQEWEQLSSTRGGDLGLGGEIQSDPG